MLDFGLREVIRKAGDCFMSNYVEQIVEKYRYPEELDSVTKSTVFNPLADKIRQWTSVSNLPLINVGLSGSRAKGTAVALSTAFDVFISLSSSDDTPLEDIYNSLYAHFNQPSYNCRKQNVSIGITYGGKSVDLVPGRRQSQYGDDHSLYNRKQSSWMKTNISEHIRMVKNSNRIIEIAAAKIWRHRHSLEFPSIFLELVTIQALKNHRVAEHDNNFLSLLDYIRDNIQSVRIVDPANSNNIISDELTAADKKTLSAQAGKSRNEEKWASIIW